MGTTIRPEISKKNRYWIDKHRYYECKLDRILDTFGFAMSFPRITLLV